MDHEILISSSSSTEASKPPPLLWLPNELLDEIFRFAYKDEPVHRPICRRLYPIQQKYLYRRVRLDSYEALGSFCFAMRTVPVVRKHVVELELRMEGASNYASNDAHEYTPSIGDEDSDGEGGASQVVTPLQLSLLLARLPDPRVLDLQELDDALMKVVLLGKTTPRNLALLEVLKISADVLYIEDEQGSEVQWLRQLAQLPQLKEFHLEQFEMGAFLPVVGLPPPPLQALTTLVIAARAWDMWVGPPLREVAPNLLHLSLQEFEDGPEFTEILHSAPISLRSLTLSSRVALTFEGPQRPAIDNVLPLFTHLEHLALCEDTFTPNGILPSLRSLPALHSLAFSLGSHVTDELLLGILDGPLRLAHLRRLTLDYVNCSRGPTMASKGYCLPPEDEAAEYHMWRGWRSPVWGPDCSEEGLTAAVLAAEANGVVVDGTALDVIGWSEEAGNEMVEALLAWGNETGDYSEATEIFGDDVVQHYFAFLREECDGGDW
ncbi:hypothetical protein JCM10450v2_006776 [Rhodotorula kratochvilovae]